MNEKEQMVIAAINTARQANGLPPFRPVEEIAQAARRHAADMATHYDMIHVGSDGSDGGRRMREAGYDWLA